MAKRKGLKKETFPSLRNRIVEFTTLPASELVPHPQNWRRHGSFQKNVLSGLLSEIGFAGAVLARRQADGKLQIIDGHLRAEIATKEQVPVLITDLTEEEAVKLLAFFDPISQLAVPDLSQFNKLLEDIVFVDDGLTTFKNMLAQEVITPEGQGQKIGNGIGNSVKLVIYGADAALVERALASTGRKNRAEAIRVLCQAFLGEADGVLEKLLQTR